MFYHTHVYTHLTIPPNPFLSLNLHLPVGSSLKKCHVALSPLHTQTVPFATHGIAHSTRGRILSGRRSTFSGYLTSGILSDRRSTFSDISHPEFCPADVPPSSDISHPEFCPTDVPPSPDISYPAPDAEWERKAIQLPRTDRFESSNSVYPESIRS